MQSFISLLCLYILIYRNDFNIKYNGNTLGRYQFFIQFNNQINN